MVFVEKVVDSLITIVAFMSAQIILIIAIIVMVIIIKFIFKGVK